MFYTDETSLYFSLARERYRIHLARTAGKPWPWTEDPIFQQYRFCNLFRELDKTTAWFKTNVRDDLVNHPAVLLATLVFRWHNKIEIGKCIFKQHLLDGGTPWDKFIVSGDVTYIRSAIRSVYPNGPYVTGSYMISSPHGVDKLTGITNLYKDFWTNSNWQQFTSYMLDNQGEVTLEGFTRWLQEFTFMGPFLAYEVATDLRHTALLRFAPDKETWANVGPGCKRGLNRLSKRTLNGADNGRKRWGNSIPEKQALEEMRILLEMSRDITYWPKQWPTWEMREVEHWLCEYDKWSRVKANEGAPRQLFRIPT